VDEGVTARIVHKVVDIALIVGVAAGVIWEAAAIAIIDATEGTVVAEAEVTVVVHGAAFDKPKAVVGGAEFGVTPMVVGIMAVGGIGVKGKLAVDVITAVLR